jgi:hypothetical protein
MNQTASYRPVSPLAVAAVVVGGFSALALIGPFFWAVPLVAAGLSCAALTDLGREGSLKAGRMAALAGLALAIGFGSQAVAARATSRWISAERAQAATSLWLDAIRQERLADARSMCHSAAVGAVAAVTTACGGVPPAEVRTVGSSEEAPNAWEVRVRMGPCGPAPFLTLRLVLAPQVSSQQGRVFERWTVMSCEPVP